MLKFVSFFSFLFVITYVFCSICLFIEFCHKISIERNHTQRINSLPIIQPYVCKCYLADKVGALGAIWHFPIISEMHIFVCCHWKWRCSYSSRIWIKCTNFTYKMDLDSEKLCAIRCAIIRENKIYNYWESKCWRQR